MHSAHIPVDNYAQFAAEFNSVKFNAEEWVLLAKNAGMKNIVITSKHHDVFAMFGSRASTYNIVDATPFRRDPLKELAAACQKHGIKLGFYYSQAQDWHQAGGASYDGHWDPAQNGSMDDYLKNTAMPQAREIQSNYERIAVLWWDTPANMTRERALQFLPLLGAVCAVRKSFVLRDRQEVSKSSYPKRPRFSLGFWSLYIAKPRKSRFLPHAPLARGIHRDVYWEPAEGVRAAMRVTVTQPLFAWAMLEDSASLETVRRCLEAIPDALLLKGLRQARGHGRDDYPVSVLWGVAVLTPLLRHPSYDACLAELRRNPTLCRLLGVETEAQVPKHWNLSRFLDVLGIPPT